MKKILFFSILCFSVFCSQTKVLQKLRLLSSDCSGHGYLFKGKCFCQSQWSGQSCEKATGHISYDNPNDQCDDLIYRLDNLLNISPEFYNNDDDEFPRLSGDSIGQEEAAYGDKGNSWIRMHECVSSGFKIFGNFDVTDIKQGALGNCYLLAAFASLANIRKGEIIKNAFITQTDNEKHVYITKWLIDGKPRFVAVDEWIPGKSGTPSFSKVTEDNEFWAIILEKAWAKIHGTFMRTQGGWHTNVWKSLSQAPVFDAYHSEKQFTSETVYTFVKDLLSKQYAVGAATVSVPGTKEVEGHAYSILGAYEVTLDNGTKEKLFRMYNPWNSDYWNENPWGDKATVWTPKLKAQVNYVEKNDGQFYTSTKDFLKNFGATNWAEIQQDYEISYQDIAMHQNPSSQYPTKFDTKFTVTGNGGKTLYVLIDATDSRLTQKCNKPFWVYNLKVTTPNGKTYEGKDTSDGITIKIENASDGTYTVNADVLKYQDYALYFTITTYNYRNTVNFVAKENNEISFPSKLNCPGNCNGQGRCNVFNGKCHCYYPFSGASCGGSEERECPDNCNNHGFCDKKTGQCQCENGYSLPKCALAKCIDKSNSCKEFIQNGDCKPTSVYYQYMIESCGQACADAGYVAGFEDCAGKPNPNPPKPPEPTPDPNAPCKDEMGSACKVYTDQGDCSDGSQNQEWMISKIISENKIKLLKEYCKLSCRNAGFTKGFEGCVLPTPEPACKDKIDLSNCQHFVKLGDCEPKAEYHEWMTKQCAKTCANAGYREGFEFCGNEINPNPPPKPVPIDPNCKDNEGTDCATLAKQGYCIKSEAYMSQRCAKTCDLCDD